MRSAARSMPPSQAALSDVRCNIGKKSGVLINLPNEGDEPEIEHVKG